MWKKLKRWAMTMKARWYMYRLTRAISQARALIRVHGPLPHLAHQVERGEAILEKHRSFIEGHK